MNGRFAEYATSGAFTLALSRNQVSSLIMLEGGAYCGLAPSFAALERKGLAEAVPAPTPDNPERVEFRPTHAGLLTIALTREAGLTNGSRDPVAAELASLRAEIEARRVEAADALTLARSAMARRDELELDLQNEKAMRAGDKLTVRILRRDPIPEVPIEALRERIGTP